MTFYIVDKNEVQLTQMEKTGERFDDYEDALQNAREWAEACPGLCFQIVRVIATVYCPIGKAVVEST